MRLRHLALVAFTALTCLLGVARADNMATIAITPATGEVTLQPRWFIGGDLSGFHFMAQDLSLGGGPNQFYSIKGTPIPPGGDIAAFNRYIAASGAATPHADIGSKLTPNAYSALTSADPDVGFGAVNLYFIHRKDSGDYFSSIVPSSGIASAVTDLKPMSGPGGPATLGEKGYFGLTFAAANIGYGLNQFYYLRNDPVTGLTKFGTLEPALLGASADQFDLGVAGYNALVFAGSDVGYGVDKMYYLRLDPVTGFTIFGTLHPLTGRASDIANLGSVYTTLTHAPGDVGFGSSQFYTTGSVNPTWQSVSFAAIDDRLISAGSFTVKPSASSALPLTLTVVPGSTGAASISSPVAGVFTVTPTAPGVITLQATQAGSLAPALEYNMLRQRFTATGTTLLGITAQPAADTVVPGSTVEFAVVAEGTSALGYQWRKDEANVVGNASATTPTLSLPNVQNTDAGTYDVVITNGSGSIVSDPVVLTVTAAAPTITNPTLTAGSTVGAAFSYTIVANNAPTLFSAHPLPAGLSLNTTSGVISGTPTGSGSTAVLLGATNGAGTDNATLTITVAAAGTAPNITNSPLTAAGTVGTAFNFAITATGSPTGYGATPLPAGLVRNATTGVISGTPTAAGTTTVMLGATNSTGTGSATLTVTIAAAGVVPVITNNQVPATGTAGTPFSHVITASGLPTSYTATPLPPGLVINPTTGVISGTPTTTGNWTVVITATNNTGTATTSLEIHLEPTPSSQIVNFSARALSGPGYQTLIMGFVVAGQQQHLLVRGVGPSLAPYGVVDVLVDPMLTLFDGEGALVVNDDWHTSSGGVNQSVAIAAAAAQVGAFPLLPTSKDAALLFTVNQGVHTTGLVRPNSTTGIALTEVYDLDRSPATRLINVSARMNVTGGEGVLIAGLVIAGNAPTTVLIRGVGPGLSPFGVAGVLPNPQIRVHADGQLVAANDNWSDGPTPPAELAEAAARVGAFGLDAGSLDAALLLTLEPGVYSVVVSGVGEPTGVALIEVYDLR